MHHSIELYVPAESTNEMLEELKRNDNVISLAVNRGAAVKPEGDVLTVHVLNKGVDEVMLLAKRAEKFGAASSSTSELTSIVDPEHETEIKNDVDEGLWEEMEAGLRHHGRITLNFLLLMALGGATATMGLIENPTPQAIAFVGAAMLAPGFEPLAKVPLGALLGRWDTVWRGLKSALIGYGVIIAASALTFWLLMMLGETSALHLARNPEVRSLSLPDARAIGFSIVGGLAGMIIITANRRSVIAGPLVLLAIIPAAALMGAALACAQPGLFLQGLERWSLDVLIIWLSGALIVWLKQRTAHRLRPKLAA